MPTVTPVDAYVYDVDKSAAYSEGGGNHITLTTTDSTLAGAESGNVLIADLLAGICLGDYNADTDEVVIDIAGVHNISVTAKDGSGNSAVKLGDLICYDTSEINKDYANGIPFGIALGTVTSGSEDDIPVRIIPGLPAAFAAIKALIAAS